MSARPPRRWRPRAAAAVLVLAAACGAEREPGTWELYTAFLEGGRVEIVASPGPLLEQAHRLAERVRAEHTGEERPLRVSARATTDRGDRAAARVRLGILDEPDVVDLLARAGVEVLPGGGFRVLGHEHVERSDAVAVSMADPERPGLPLVVVAGPDAASVAARARELPAPWVPALRTWSGTGAGLEVELELDGTPRAETLIDRGLGRRRRWDAATRVARAGLSFHVDEAVDPVRFARYAELCERAVGRATHWLECETPTAARPVRVLVYAHAEDFERDHARAELGAFDRASGAVHVLLAPGVPDDGGAAVARAAAHAALGDPAEAWTMEGLGPAAAKRWWGWSIDRWQARLRFAGVMPTLDALRDPRSDAVLSEHVLAPARALLVRRAASSEGLLRRVWGGEELERLGEISLDGAFPSELEQALFEPGVRRNAGQPGQRGAVVFAGAAPDAMLRSPYVPRSVDASVDELRALGANAISLTAQVAVQPFEPALVTTRPRALDGLSSDAALASALASARARGMQSLLMLEPLFAPWSTWGDGALFTSKGEIELFFERFRRMARHYGLLASLLHVDSLCLGNALTNASNTIVHETDPAWVREAKVHRLQLWRDLGSATRRVFPGELLYGARTLEEVERVAFWASFDTIGLLGFPPLAPTDVPEPGAARLQASLRQELDRALEVAERFGRHVTYVQLGFPAREEAWHDPFVPRGGVSPESQERYYAALAAVLREVPGRYDSLGLFLWNWDPRSPADPLRGGGYSPRGMPAVSHLESVFRAP